MTSIRHWQIAGAEHEPIIGTVHVPERPRGVVLLAHGFKGYKDYGMFPRIAQAFTAARFIAHRFNFSHSGMTNDIETFARADLFENDTWNKQVVDYRAVIAGVDGGELEGQGLPLIMFGHSRGGVTALLTAGRFFSGPTAVAPAGVITAAAPAECCSLADADREQLLVDGAIESPSSRTGQTLRVGKSWLQEQLDDPAGHDLLALVQRITCPVLAIHGRADPTVPPQSAPKIAAAVPDGESLLIDNANHVFNTSNPLPDGAPMSPELQQLMSAGMEFANSVAEGVS